MSWWKRLTGGLGKTAQQVSVGLKRAVGLSATLDAATLEALEEVLLQADVGAATATAILDELKQYDLPEPLTQDAVSGALAEIVAARLGKLAAAAPLAGKGSARPCVMVVAGVNGGGKTTSIGKLAARWAQDGQRVLVAAADTFRAGAVAQLAVWAERAGARGQVSIVEPAKANEDPGGVAYRAVERGVAEGYDIVLIDTAGRLPNRADLMEELKKIRRVVQKIDPTAPHHTLLVLDGTQGQATLRQMREFKSQAAVDGLIITKLDGSAKAGFLLPLAAGPDAVPVYYVGVGEGLEDIGNFDATAFARGLLGLADA